MMSITSCHSRTLTQVFVVLGIIIAIISISCDTDADLWQDSRPHYHYQSPVGDETDDPRPPTVVAPLPG